MVGVTVCQGRGMEWMQAWREASLGEGGFWRREIPADHFRTASGAVMAEAMVRLLERSVGRRGSPQSGAAVPARQRAGAAADLTVVDVGAGDGTLLAHMATLLCDANIRLIAVDVRPRPADLDPCVEWLQGEAPDCLETVGPIRGLVMAHEWLDEIPCMVIEVDDEERRRVVQVNLDGREYLGDTLADGSPEAAWLDRWWPIHRPGQRAEVGIWRDRAWARLCAHMAHGTVVATDYGVAADNLPFRGTLTAYRDGAVVPAVADGTVGITAHVMWESCAAATSPAGEITPQREALMALGIDAQLPDPSAMTEQDYLVALARASQVRTLLDPRGLGSFGWLCHHVA